MHCLLLFAVCAVINFTVFKSSDFEIVQLKTSYSGKVI